MFRQLPHARETIFSGDVLTNDGGKLSYIFKSRQIQSGKQSKGQSGEASCPQKMKRLKRWRQSQTSSLKKTPNAKTKKDRPERSGLLNLKA